MFCSDETRGYILFNGDQELFCLIDFLGDISRLNGRHYFFGSYLEDEIFNAVMYQHPPLWREFRLPEELLHVDRNKEDAPEPWETRDLWLKAQPEEMKVYWECNQILQQMCWAEPDERWESSVAAYYVAQLFRNGVGSKDWDALMLKCKYGRKPIDPPTGYLWREPHFSMDRWRMERLGYRDVPLDETPEFRFG